MAASELQLTRQPVADRTALVCIPGTFCSPEVFTLLDEASFPNLQLLPLSWMTSPGPWDIPTLGQRVAELLRELNLGPVLLVGHSTGGPIALEAALAAPELVSGLLLADTGANTQGHGDISSIIRAIEGGVGPELGQQLLRRSFYYQPEESLIKSLTTYATAVPPEAALQALQSQAVLDLAGELSAITAPVMIVHGQHDQARPVAHAQVLATLLPQAELRILDSGHTPMVEALPAYEQALQRLCVLVAARG